MRHLVVRSLVSVVLLSPWSRVLADPSPELSLGVTGRYLESSFGDREYLAMLEVGATLDPVESPEERPPESAETSEPEASERPERAGRRSARSRAEAAADAVLDQCPFGVVPEFVGELMSAAGEAAGLDAAMERLDSAESRARNSAWLPDLKFRAGRDVDQSLRLTPTTDDPYRYTQSDGVSFIYEGTVSWRLGRLVFASEEPGLERLRLVRLRERERLLEQLLPLVEAWVLHTCEVQAWPKNRSFQRRLLNTEIALNQLTGGWFWRNKLRGIALLPPPLPAPPAPPRPVSRADQPDPPIEAGDPVRFAVSGRHALRHSQSPR